MMSKIQKMWLFILMIIIPELFFGFTLSFILFLMNAEMNIPTLSYFVDPNNTFFTDHKNYIFLSLLIEFLGTLGLLVINKKSNNKIFKSFLFIFLLWVFLIFITGYSIANSNFIL